jgi:hypothetical protein
MPGIAGLQPGSFGLAKLELGDPRSSDGILLSPHEEPDCWRYRAIKIGLMQLQPDLDSFRRVMRTSIVSTGLAQWQAERFVRFAPGRGN